MTSPPFTSYIVRAQLMDMKLAFCLAVCTKEIEISTQCRIPKFKLFAQTFDPYEPICGALHEDLATNEPIPMLPLFPLLKSPHPIPTQTARGYGLFSRFLRAADNSSRVFLPLSLPFLRVQLVLFLIRGFPLLPECLYTFLPPLLRFPLPFLPFFPSSACSVQHPYSPVVLSNRSHPGARVEREVVALRIRLRMFLEKVSLILS